MQPLGTKNSRNLSGPTNHVPSQDNKKSPNLLVPLVLKFKIQEIGTDNKINFIKTKKKPFETNKKTFKN
jgi:hypothetical protein